MDKRVPEVRLKGFTDDWEQHSLGNIVKRITRKNTNLDSTLPLTISAQKGLIDQESFFDKKIASKDVSGYYLIKKGEFAYNKSYSNGYPWGTIKRLDRYDMGVLSTLYIVFVPTKVNSNFLTKYYDTTYWYRELSMNASEGARNHGLLNISPSDFFNTKLTISQTHEEQKKIGNFISRLDLLIDLQQRELDLYKKLRKGLLQKLFPSDGENVPIVRFADFDENWKQYKLHQIFQYEQPSKYIVTSTDYNTNYEIPVLTAGKSFILGYSNEHYGIKSANKNNPIIIFDDFTVGMHYVDFPFKVKSSAMKLISLKSNDNNSIFMYYILKKIHYVPQGHERQWISKFSQFDTLIPFTSEQNKIGDILNNIDKLLKSRKYKLNEISMLKKYYLQKLFI